MADGKLRFTACGFEQERWWLEKSTMFTTPNHSQIPEPFALTTQNHSDSPDTYI